MVSSTQQSSRIRRRKQSTNGKTNKRERRRFGTPVFPVHVEGYDPKAADAPSVAADKKLKQFGTRERNREQHGEPRISREAQPSAYQAHRP
jgi:hypothetical protein